MEVTGLTKLKVKVKVNDCWRTQVEPSEVQKAGKWQDREDAGRAVPAVRRTVWASDLPRLRNQSPLPPRAGSQG